MTAIPFWYVLLLAAATAAAALWVGLACSAVAALAKKHATSNPY